MLQPRFSRHVRSPLLRSLALALLPLALLGCGQSPKPPAQGAHVAVAATTPAQFEDRLVASIYTPVDLAFTPDGRLLIASQSGKLRVYQNGALQSTPALDLAGSLCTSNGWGLLGLTVDPQFASNHYLYTYYSSNKNGNCTQNQANGPVNRVSRFTMSGNTVDRSSEKVLLDNIPAFSGAHNGGALAFGADGKLYISVGDGFCKIGDTTQCAGQNPNSRSRAVLLGKILRVNKDGSVPLDNPFVNESGARRCGDPAGVTSGTGPCTETFAWGLRNPFRMAVKPGTSDLYINDVGQDTWEEVNLGRSGADYGWNLREGNCVQGSTTDCGAPPSGMVNPIFSYDHSAGCKSITAGAFVPVGVWPKEFDGAYLYADYVCGSIFRLAPSGSGYVSVPFVTGLGESSAVAMTFGPYGSTQALYYLSYANGGEVRRIAYTGASNRAPVASAGASPTSGTLPLTVNFDASASQDPDGDPLQFSWSFGDGSPAASGVKVAHTYTAAGTFAATLTVTDGRGGSASASVRIDAGNTAPQVQILSPGAGDLFRVGQTVTLRASATDAEDGPLADSQLSWKVELRHNDDHSHPLLGPESGNNLSFTTPAPEDLQATERSYLLITLTATDSKGLSRTITQKFQPHRVNVTLATQPAGLSLGVNGMTFTAPHSFVSWEGYGLNVSAPTSQAGYSWQSWSDGGAASHTLTTPAADATFTAQYQAQAGQSVTGLTLIDTDTDQPVSGFNPIPAGAQLILSELPAHLSLRANTTPAAVGSVRFVLSGSEVRTESYAPYSIAGDSARGDGSTDYLPWTLPSGYQTLVVTPYSGAGGTGSAGSPLRLDFTVRADRPAQLVSGLTLINADTDQPVPGFDPIPQNAVIDRAALGLANLTVRANTSPAGVGSVRFVLGNQTISTENYAPYSVAGDSARTDGSTDYRPWSQAAGSYTLTVTPYSATNGGGSAGGALTLKYTLK